MSAVIRSAIGPAAVPQHAGASQPVHVNLSGAFYASRAALQHMLDRCYGVRFGPRRVPNTPTLPEARTASSPGPAEHVHQRRGTAADQPGHAEGDRSDCAFGRVKRRGVGRHLEHRQRQAKLINCAAAG
jgi:hypothetical protein